MTQKTVLLTSWGRGHGHIARLEKIGRAFDHEGWTPIVYGHSNSMHVQRILEAGWQYHRYEPWAEEIDPWMDWNKGRVLSASVALDREFLRRVRPSLVVNDNRVSMMLAALAEQIPIVSLCQDNQLPGYCYDGRTTPETWLLPIDAINHELVAIGHLPISDDARWLFCRSRVAIPSSEDLEPVDWFASPEVDVVYTGLLDRGSGGAGAHATSLLFYRTVGKIDPEFREAFSSWPGRIYIATGGSRLDDDGCGPLGLRNLEVAPLWDLDRIGHSLQAIVHHGGHGITLKCLADRIPSVALPGHNPERLANGMRAASEGPNLVLHPPALVGTVWGAAVDETGDRPPWTEIRAAIDSLPDRAISETTDIDVTADQKRLVALLTAAPHAPR
ncbi:hypothetical protein [Leifsonia naganoensis]|uniref:Glycosyl transferase family 28 C-terminal domain-containing protein n=1 Tax=Leifsonia naganoensis TaxID=150025 RepID=A0A853DL09_9MICO|nr:hypothetical protein [Leifsonia naganoensis]NYK08937.1 hypothetical protein [Leifsonia naganoensis]